MRILHIGSLSKVEQNGVHRAIHTLAHLSMAQGHQVGVLNFSRSARTPGTRDLDGVSALTLPVRGLPGSVGSHAQFLGAESRAALEQLMKEWDVLHLHSVFQVDHVFVSRRGVPYVVTPHGGYHPRIVDGSAAMTKRLWLAAFDRSLLRRAALVQTLSDSESRHVAALQPRAPTRVLPIPIVGSVPAGTDRRREADDPIVFIGRMDIAHKGLDLLLTAWARSTWSSGQGGHLVLAGPADSETNGRLECLIDELSLRNSVELIGPVHGADKDALLARAKWFVHASRWEGLPLSMLEAASAGVPLLGTHETNLTERITKHAGGLVSEVSVASISDMLDRAHALPEDQRQHMVEGAVELARGFEPGDLADDYERLYQDAVR
ncbi:glycosyltransferase family 4 protein [Nocardioides sp.]|uniref:glycosyltransferase family 4 protein n=1 Tax=Nocardioides sp. TaxID=35761 RepID=UPI0031FEF76C|nr:group 1 glycosyl transferase [Nocardioides sp.]